MFPFFSRLWLGLIGKVCSWRKDKSRAAKSRRRKGRGRKILLVLTALVLLGLWDSNCRLEIGRYTLYQQELPAAFDGFEMVLISDLHSQEWGQGNSRLLKKLEKLSPDILLMAGDMVNSEDASFEGFLSLAEELGGRYPCYYIRGNHEQALEEPVLAGLLQRLEQAGIAVLDNQSIVLERRGAQINLYGLWFHLAYYKDAGDPLTRDIHFGPAAIEKVLGEAREGYTILLTHNPVYFPTYAEWGADLTLAGHIHGGIIRLPGLGGLLSPQRELFPPYSAGLYYQGEQALLVTRGLGNGHFGLRFNNPPEIAHLTLRRGAGGLE